MKKISEEKSYLLTYLPLSTFLRIPQSRLPLAEIVANFCTCGSSLTRQSLAESELFIILCNAILLIFSNVFAVTRTCVLICIELNICVQPSSGYRNFTPSSKVAFKLNITFLNNEHDMSETILFILCLRSLVELGFRCVAGLPFPNKQTHIA